MGIADRLSVSLESTGNIQFWQGHNPGPNECLLFAYYGATDSYADLIESWLDDFNSQEPNSDAWDDITAEDVRAAIVRQLADYPGMIRGKRALGKVSDIARDYGEANGHNYHQTRGKRSCACCSGPEGEPPSAVLLVTLEPEEEGTD